MDSTLVTSSRKNSAWTRCAILPFSKPKTTVSFRARNDNSNRDDNKELVKYNILILFFAKIKYLRRYKKAKRKG